MKTTSFQNSIHISKYVGDIIAVYVNLILIAHKQTSFEVQVQLIVDESVIIDHLCDLSEHSRCSNFRSSDVQRMLKRMRLSSHESINPCRSKANPLQVELIS